MIFSAECIPMSDICWCCRYWAVTYPHYIHSRNSTSIWMLISTVWIMSIIVSLAPLLGWKDENWSLNVQDGKCMVSRYIRYTACESEKARLRIVRMLAASKKFCKTP